MNRYLGKEYRNFEDRNSQSISKRNNSANMSYVNKQKLKVGARSAHKECATLNKIFHHKEGERESNADLIKPERNHPTKRVISVCPPNLRNIDKFIFLNQQLKENNSQKREYFQNRKIASAEPTLSKTTNISKNFQKLFNEVQKTDSTIEVNSQRFPKIDSNNSKKESFNLSKFNYVFDSEHNNKNKSRIQPLKLNNRLAKQDQLINKPSSTNRIPPLISPQQFKTCLKPYVEHYAGLTQNCREAMEDFHVVYDQFNNKPNQALFGIFDGHGGVDIAEKLKDEIGTRFSKLVNSTSSGEAAVSIENLLKFLFRKLDEDILKQFTDPNIKYESTNFSSMGSTCTVIFLSKESNNTFLYCANVGDSRALIVSKGGATRISYDHKPTDDFENKRIKGSGGAIFGGRLFGQFSLTRAIGDAAIKKWVISEPFIKKLAVSDNDKYVVIASDGIWDVITDDNCYELSIGKSTAKEYCEELINTAISRWSKDNISCIVIKLN